MTCRISPDTPNGFLNDRARFGDSHPRYRQANASIPQTARCIIALGHLATDFSRRAIPGVPGRIDSAASQNPG